MKPLKLCIELVPSTCWFKNLRSLLSTAQWDLVRRDIYGKASFRCEICGGVGTRHPVEAHEKWVYLDRKCVQILAGLEALCPACHETKHFGFAQVNGREDIAIKHFMKVNKILRNDALQVIGEAFERWRERSGKEWFVDTSWLSREYGINLRK